MVRSKPGDTSKTLIYKEIRRSIIMGHRKPGERLDLEMLSKGYGTSVTPVRDALQMLSQEGLVTIRPRSGYFVTHITLKQLRDMLELREILEVASIERATTRITEKQLEQLEYIHAGYTGEDDESYDRYMDENRHVHYLIAQASGNQELAEMLGHLLDRLANFMVLCRAGGTLESRHEVLIEVLRTRDVAAARQAMLDEINQTRETILERVIQEEGASWRLGTQASK
ncbi:MAG: GntR family transcriptional regulator [Anaerolineales bacterium]|nr:GntR family transcriptional regulator [Anaerolineales bacterium]